MKPTLQQIKEKLAGKEVVDFPVYIDPYDGIDIHTRPVGQPVINFIFNTDCFDWETNYFKRQKALDKIRSVLQKYNWKYIEIVLREHHCITADLPENTETTYLFFITKVDIDNNRVYLESGSVAK